ncbi:hypothetical protein QTO34_005563 [Cnephaeus nilssonii]|uniref:Uncharacterized protein n=1 Tax=Cnephaeus nilssonii TaxID=3371016 RepID=A0AA40HNQ4_CNENI|nr:hypothetical protein QTO34_005563 [Eptesicus nilssonii]
MFSKKQKKTDYGAGHLCGEEDHLKRTKSLQMEGHFPIWLISEPPRLCFCSDCCPFYIDSHLNFLSNDDTFQAQSKQAELSSDFYSSSLISRMPGTSSRQTSSCPAY